MPKPPPGADAPGRQPETRGLKRRCHGKCVHIGAGRPLPFPMELLREPTHETPPRPCCSCRGAGAPQAAALAADKPAEPAASSQGRQLVRLARPSPERLVPASATCPTSCPWTRHEEQSDLERPGYGGLTTPIIQNGRVYLINHTGEGQSRSGARRLLRRAGRPSARRAQIQRLPDRHGRGSRRLDVAGRRSRNRQRLRPRHQRHVLLLRQGRQRFSGRIR